MTFEERMAELGVDLSDLPLGYSLSKEKAKSISDIACRWFVDEDSPDGVALRNIVSIPLFQYILHLIDIIDRMETRLDNVIGERNYLLKYYGYDCKECVKYPDCSTLADSDDFTCVGSILDDWAGVPEDWRADDD